jgi:hypothetical protein
LDDSTSITKSLNGFETLFTPAMPRSAASTKKRSGDWRLSGKRLEDRILAIYADKLDGLIDSGLLRKMSAGETGPLPTRDRTTPERE